MNSFAPALRTIRRYAGRARELHDQFRMEHFMYSLPEDIRKDLGWPDVYAERVERRL